MLQRALTLEIELAAERDLEPLRARARALGNPAGPEGGPPWADLPGLHFASVVVIADDPDRTHPSRPDGPTLAPVLVIELNFDGDARVFLTRFVERSRDALDALLADAPGYPAQSAEAREVVAFLLARDIGADAFYVGAPGRSVEQIRDEVELSRQARASLDPREFPDTREAFWHKLQARLQQPLSQLAARLPMLPARVVLSLRGLRGPRTLARVVGRASLALATVLGLVFLGDLLGVYTLAEAPVGGRVLSGLWILAAVSWIGALGVASWRQRTLHVTARFRRATALARAQELGWHALVLAVALGVLHALRFAGVQGFFATLALALAVGAGALLLSTVLAAIGYIAVGPRLGACLGAIAALGFLASSLTAATWGQIAWLVGIVAVITLAVVAGAGLAVLYALGRRELEDPVDPTRWDVDHLARMSEHEDLQLQNHFASVTWIKPGRFRLRLLRSVLRAVHLAASTVFTLGDLGGIVSIHFARFVILRDTRRLLFLTNYDGPWNGYLDDFVAVPGVTAVWGNSAGFPRPFLLIGDGARDEQRFKAYARASQVETLTWYSAYPNLSVHDVQAATETRLALMRPVDAPLTGVYGTVWRWVSRPLDPAALDAAIRRL